MDRFITLTSANPGVGKVRFNIDNIAYYFTKGHATMIVMTVPGVMENVAEKREEVDRLIAEKTTFKIN